MARLWKDIHPNAADNLKSGFQATGLHPFNPHEVLKNLPDVDASSGESEEIGRLLDE